MTLLVIHVYTNYINKGDAIINYDHSQHELSMVILAMGCILFTIAMYNLFTVNEDYITVNTSMYCSSCADFDSIFIRSSTWTSISGSVMYVNHFSCQESRAV